MNYHFTYGDCIVSCISHKYIAILILASIFALISPLSYAYRVSVIMSQGSPANDKAKASFFESKKLQCISTSNINGSLEQGVRVARQIQKARPDLVLAVGTTAALAAKEELRGIPIVFCMVLNPVSSGLLRSMENHEGNITGASMDIPLRTQFEYIRSVVRNAKSIGVIYNSKETGIIIGEAFEVARNMNFKFVAKSISSEREVPDALKSLLNSVDVIWSVADSKVFDSQSTQYILLNTLRAGVPFIGLSPSFVRAGALMALSCDYGDIGRQAGSGDRY